MLLFFFLVPHANAPGCRGALRRVAYSYSALQDTHRLLMTLDRHSMEWWLERSNSHGHGHETDPSATTSATNPLPPPTPLLLPGRRGHGMLLHATLAWETPYS
jgi:hypothetical protein